jgi:hypothetical protein
MSFIKKKVAYFVGGGGYTLLYINVTYQWPLLYIKKLMLH